jgi:hypothetical protein
MQFNSMHFQKSSLAKHLPDTPPYNAVSQCPLSSVPRFSVLSSDSRFQVTSYVQRAKLTGIEAKYYWPEEGNKIIDGE